MLDSSEDLELDAIATNIAEADVVALYFPMMRKTLLLDLNQAGLDPDNLEGMAWGPPLANGHRRLVLVADDNFNPLQKTRFMAFELAP